jgi:hypothetical protein
MSFRTFCQWKGAGLRLSIKVARHAIRRSRSTAARCKHDAFFVLRACRHKGASTQAQAAGRHLVHAPNGAWLCASQSLGNVPVVALSTSAPRARLVDTGIATTLLRQTAHFLQAAMRLTQIRSYSVPRCGD